ncbi:hypothetical protein HMPREF1401_00465 [Helicobacter pylori GAM120Ai]|uniref:Uncharacterized protein n=1 Tax=Helicobacter pylori GAM120Ai TaxID=1159029 RepID=A0AAV3IGR8_HELPX|nr:hypothetical protein HMPREF1401_00465 [Helicobacter pylori GAM120Ai]
MSSDFTNIFIGADNSKRTKFDLLDSKKSPYQFPFVIICP